VIRLCGTPHFRSPSCAASRKPRRRCVDPLGLPDAEIRAVWPAAGLTYSPLWYRGPDEIRDAINSAKIFSRSRHALIRVYDANRSAALMSVFAAIGCGCLPPYGNYLSTMLPRPFTDLEWHKGKKHRHHRLSLLLRGLLATSRHTSVGSEQLICHSRESFRARFQCVAQHCDTR
jgi:hypothetical protein